MVGSRTPAQALSMCNSSSCRFKKYHGALDGLGVTSALARFSSGALMKTERMRKVMVKTTAEMNSMKTRSGHTSTSSSRSRLGRGRAGWAGWAGGLSASTAMRGPALLEGPRHAAIAADAPEVHRHHDRRQQRERDDVKGVEADEGVGTDLVAAENDQLRLIAEVGSRP